jgi:hypothetical protein
MQIPRRGQIKEREEGKKQLKRNRVTGAEKLVQT